MSPEKLIRYGLDAGCVLVGLGGIVYQIYTGRPDAVGMGTCVTLLAIAGGVNVKQLLSSATPGGPGSSSPSQPSVSPLPSSSAPSEGEA